jgi:hypothetical protein
MISTYATHANRECFHIKHQSLPEPVLYQNQVFSTALSGLKCIKPTKPEPGEVSLMNSTYSQNADQHSTSQQNPTNLTAVSRRAQTIISCGSMIIMASQRHDPTMSRNCTATPKPTPPGIQQLRILAGSRHFSHSTYIFQGIPDTQATLSHLASSMVEQN